MAIFTRGKLLYSWNLNFRPREYGTCPFSAAFWMQIACWRIPLIFVTWIHIFASSLFFSTQNLPFPSSRVVTYKSPPESFQKVQLFNFGGHLGNFFQCSPGSPDILMIPREPNMKLLSVTSPDALTWFISSQLFQPDPDVQYYFANGRMLKEAPTHWMTPAQHPTTVMCVSKRGLTFSGEMCPGPELWDLSVFSHVGLPTTSQWKGGKFLWYAWTVFIYKSHLL